MRKNSKEKLSNRGKRWTFIGKVYGPDSIVSQAILIVPDILLPLKCDQENTCVEMSSVFFFFLETVVEIPTYSVELNDIIFI